MEKLWPYADLQLYGPHRPRIFATGWIAQPLQEKLRYSGLIYIMGEKINVEL